MAYIVDKAFAEKRERKKVLRNVHIDVLFTLPKRAKKRCDEVRMG